MSSVYYSHISQYDPLIIQEAIKVAVESLGGVDQVFGDRKKLLIKPNLIQASLAETSTITHPAVIQATADYLLENGFEVAVADSPAFGSAESCIRKLGIYADLQQKGVKVFTFRKNQPLQKTSECLPNLGIAKELAEYDGVVNLPKLKAHQQIQFSGATKNLYGCIAGKRKAWLHTRCQNDKLIFAEILLKIAASVQPVLNIADGIMAMEGNGPLSGSPYSLNSLLISEDYLALDGFFCRLIGLAPQETSLFQVVGKVDWANIKGDTWAPKSDFQLAKPMDITFNPIQMLRSVIRDRVSQMKPE